MENQESTRVNLLIVDDSINNAEALVAVLRPTGYAPKAEFAENAETFEQQLQSEESHLFEMVLFSIDLTNFSLSKGIEILNKLEKNLPVVAIAKHVNDKDIVVAMQTGALDVLIRSQPDRLRAVFSRELHVARMQKQLRQCQINYQESQMFNRMLMESSQDAIAYVHEGAHIYANPTYLTLFGFGDIEEIQGMPLLNLIPRKKQDKFKSFLRKLSRLSNVREQKLQTEFKRIDDNFFEAEIEFTATVFDGEPSMQIVIREKLEGQSPDLDLLTELYNRQYFLKRLQMAINDAATGKLKATLIIIGIDKFDSIKQTVGITSSDLVVQDIAKLVQRVYTEENDQHIVARFDTYTYAILYMGEVAPANKISKTLLEVVEEHVCDVEGKSITTTCHIGITGLDENSPEANELIVRAENALQQAAKRGNNVITYKPKAGEMTQKEKDYAWGEKIKESLENNTFVLAYQPIVSINGEAAERYEVLIRLHNEDGTPVSAGEFYPSAERLDLTKLIDKWVIKTAFDRQAKEGNNNLIFFVKISTSSLKDKQFLPWLSEQLKQKRLTGRNIVFQVKEGDAVTHINEVKSLIKGLKQLHCALVLDDFGSGIDSFQKLKHINPDYLKVDCALSRGLSKNKDAQETVKSIIEQAHGHAKEVIVPCVEGVNDLSVLWGMNVNYVEGNFIHKPTENLDFDFSSMAF